jgi:hypothetical protein
MMGEMTLPFEPGDTVRLREEGPNGQRGKVLVAADANGDAHVDWEIDGIELCPAEALVLVAKKPA